MQLVLKFKVEIKAITNNIQPLDLPDFNQKN